MRFLALALFILAPNFGHAVPVAIIDSGVDLRHEALKDKLWVNSKEKDDNFDNDFNGKTDDINGWNFAEKNNQVIDYKYLGTFSNDVYRYFELQLKSFKGTITQAELDWIALKRKDEAFHKEMGIFGNFVHGTHVSGIAAKDAPNAQIIAMKLMATEVKTPDFKGIGGKPPSGKGGLPDTKVVDMLLKKAFDALAGQQGKMLQDIGLYTWFTKARVANASFGSSKAALKPMFTILLKMVYQKDPTPEQLDRYTTYFIESVIRQGRQFMVDANETLFVVAAGNDGTDNDVDPVFPANVKRFNSVSVAATYGYSRLATFSNYGVKNVELAAPGVGINSSIPGNQYLTVSGTSQAAPFVANVAGRMLDVNPKLTFLELKTILMQTSDMKDFLKYKVASGGIVNAERAIRAAEYSLTKSVGESIVQAIVDITDVKNADPIRFVSDADDSDMLMPLNAMFKLVD